MKKIIAFALALCLAASLCACGRTSSAAEVVSAANTDTSATPASTADTSAADAAESSTVTAHERTKYDDAYEMYDPETVVMTVNGVDVHWNEYYYWIANLAGQMDSYFSGANWTDAMDDDYTYEGYIMAYAENILRQYWVIAQRAETLGIELDEEDEEYIESVYADDLQTYANGDEATFAEYLSSIYLSQSLYDRMLEISMYYSELFEQYFGSYGCDLSDEDALNYAEEQGYIHVKHILLSTQDSDGNDVSDEVAQATLEQAEELVAELREKAAEGDNEALEALFDELMNEWSADTGLAYYPNGYYFTDGTMVEEFENASKALGEYEISDPVKSTYGYHIIIRLPLDPDEEVDYNGDTLRNLAATELFSNIASEWFEEAEVEYTPEFQDLHFETLFGAIGS